MDFKTAQNYHNQLNFFISTQSPDGKIELDRNKIVGLFNSYVRCLSFIKYYLNPERSDFTLEEVSIRAKKFLEEEVIDPDHLD